MLPGDEQPDPALATYATLEEEAAFRLWRYCVEGGPDNARNFLLYAASLLGHESDWQEPRPLLRAGLYWPGRARPALDDLRAARSEEHTSELQSLMRISYAVFCLKKKTHKQNKIKHKTH